MVGFFTGFFFLLLVVPDKVVIPAGVSGRRRAGVEEGFETAASRKMKQDTEKGIFVEFCAGLGESSVRVR